MKEGPSHNDEQIPEDWKETCRTVGDLVRTVAAKMKEKGATNFGALGHEFTDEKYKKGMTREQLTQYAAWHMLIGSTPLYKISPLLDLPKEQGPVKDFLEEKLKSLQSE